MTGAQTLCATMNGVVQDNRNSLSHRELRYGENARVDGKLIGKSWRFSAFYPLGIDPTAEKVALPT
jgi:hypothetical protein